MGRAGCDRSQASRETDPVIRIMAEQRENSLYCVLCLLKCFRIQDRNVKQNKTKQKPFLLWQTECIIIMVLSTYVGLT